MSSSRIESKTVAANLQDTIERLKAIQQGLIEGATVEVVRASRATLVDDYNMLVTQVESARQLILDQGEQSPEGINFVLIGLLRAQEAVQDALSQMMAHEAQYGNEPLVSYDEIKRAISNVNNNNSPINLSIYHFCAWFEDLITHGDDRMKQFVRMRRQIDQDVDVIFPASYLANLYQNQSELLALVYKLTTKETESKLYVSLRKFKETSMLKPDQVAAQIRLILQEIFTQRALAKQQAEE